MSAFAPPSLLDLAAAAVQRRRALMRVGSATLTVTHGENTSANSVLGIRLSPLVDAVVCPLGSTSSAAQPAVLALERTGYAVILDPLCPRPLEVGTGPSIAVDVIRRSMALPTPAPTASPLALADMVWLDRILDLTLDFALGQPPRWADFAGEHPLAPSSMLVPAANPSPELLRHLRRCWKHDWEALRRRRSAGAESWLNVSPAIAAWHDEGSFARHLLSDLPDRESLLLDLPDLLRPADWDAVALTLGLRRSCS